MTGSATDMSACVSAFASPPTQPLVTIGLDKVCSCCLTKRLHEAWPDFIWVSQLLDPAADLSREIEQVESVAICGPCCMIYSMTILDSARRRIQLR